MGVRLCLCVDLDGTVLTDDGALPEQVAALVTLVHEVQGTFVVMTARSPQDVARLFETVDGRLTTWCSDGACHASVQAGEVVSVHHESVLDPQSAQAAVDEFLRARIEADVLLFSTSTHGFEITAYGDGQRDSGRHLEHFGDRRPYKRVESRDAFCRVAATRELRAVSVLERTPKAVEVAQHLSSSVDAQQLLYTEDRLPTHSWIDVVAGSVSKGEGLRRIRAASSVPLWVIAAGNGRNDLSLFAEADWTVCPTNSAPELKAVSDYEPIVACGSALVLQLHEVVDAWRVAEGCR